MSACVKVEDFRHKHFFAKIKAKFAQSSLITWHGIKQGQNLLLSRKKQSYIFGIEDCDEVREGPFENTLHSDLDMFLPE